MPEENEIVEDWELNVAELREAIGVPALLMRMEQLEAEVENLRELLAESLTYQNTIHRDLQELAGEPVVTEDLQAHIAPGGYLSFENHAPPVPGNVEDFIETLRRRPAEEGEARDRKKQGGPAPPTIEGEPHEGQ